MLIIDTCSWLKIRELDDNNILKLKELIYQSNLWATHELVKEYSHYLKDYLDFNKFSIQSVKIEKVELFFEKELDPADLSIIEFGRKYKNATVISNDGAELLILDWFKVKSFQLSEFIFFLVKESLLKKREALNAIKKLRTWRDIKEKKMKRILNEINLIR
ncbi:MAG: hypothetical protein ACTSRB_11925 [Candidatus Helarchaeota archaeon]